MVFIMFLQCLRLLWFIVFSLANLHIQGLYNVFFCALPVLSKIPLRIVVPCHALLTPMAKNSKRWGPPMQLKPKLVDAHVTKEHRRECIFTKLTFHEENARCWMCWTRFRLLQTSKIGILYNIPSPSKIE